MSSSNNPYTTPRDVDTYLTRDVAAHIGNTGQPNGPLLNCTCAVCVDSTLDISACVGDMIKDELAAADPVDSKEKFYEKYKLERTAFLRCGHFFGLSCLAKFRNGQVGVCPVCRNMSCDGCNMGFLPIVVKDMVPWPLSTAGYRPLPKFLDAVTLTAVDIAPGTKRFCAACMQGQFIREYVRLTTIFPSCPACDAARYGGGAAEEYPADHRAWRAANVDPWIRQQLVRMAEAVYPSPVDIRDPDAREIENTIMTTRRRSFVARFLMDQDLMDPLRRVLFLPCEQVREEETAPLSQTELESINRSMKRALDEGKTQYDRARTMWFRGIDDGFRYGPVNPDRPRDPNMSRQIFAEIVGVDTYEQALLRVNPMVLPNFSLPNFAL